MAKDYDSFFTVEETQAQPGKWLQQSLWQIMTELRTNWNCSHSPPSSVFAALYLTHAPLHPIAFSSVRCRVMPGIREEGRNQRKNRERMKGKERGRWSMGTQNEERMWMKW